jgi:hypothetical protein
VKEAPINPSAAQSKDTMNKLNIRANTLPVQALFSVVLHPKYGGSPTSAAQYARNVVKMIVTHTALTRQSLSSEARIAHRQGVRNENAVDA